MLHTWETGEWGGDIACDMGHLGNGEVTREQRAGSRKQEVEMREQGEQSRQQRALGHLLLGYLVKMGGGFGKVINIKQTHSINCYITKGEPEARAK